MCSKSKFKKEHILYVYHIFQSKGQGPPGTKAKWISENESGGWTAQTGIHVSNEGMRLDLVNFDKAEVPETIIKCRVSSDQFNVPPQDKVLNILHTDEIKG